MSDTQVDNAQAASARTSKLELIAELQIELDELKSRHKTMLRKYGKTLTDNRDTTRELVALREACKPLNLHRRYRDGAIKYEHLKEITS